MLALPCFLFNRRCVNTWSDLAQLRGSELCPLRRAQTIIEQSKWLLPWEQLCRAVCCQADDSLDDCSFEVRHVWGRSVRLISSRRGIGKPCCTAGANVCVCVCVGGVGGGCVVLVYPFPLVGSSKRGGVRPCEGGELGSCDLPRNEICFAALLSSCMHVGHKNQ